MMQIVSSTATGLLYKTLRYIHTYGSLIGKTWDAIDISLQLTNPAASFVFQRKQHWVWALQELSDRLNPMFKNPGYAYRFRSNWARKLEKENGTFVYTYGGIYRKQVPAVLKALKNKSTREAVISVWNSDSLLENQVHGKRTPCTLNHHFIIREHHLYLFTNMRTSDAVNLLCYDIFHHCMLQSYVAAKLGIGLGDFMLRLDHAYYQKKRRETKNIDRIIDELSLNIIAPSPVFGFTKDHLDEDMKLHYHVIELARAGSFSEALDLASTIFNLFVKEWSLSLVVAESSLRGHTLKHQFELPEFQFIHKQL